MWIAPDYLAVAQIKIFRDGLLLSCFFLALASTIVNTSIEDRSVVNEEFSFTPAEFRTLRSLRTPVHIQRFLDDMPYHHANTAWSPRLVLKHRTAHCLEGALFAAAALRVNGFHPLVMDLEAVRDDDHVLALYRVNGCWGAIAKSNYTGLRFREPVYRTIRELALSYFENYYNLRGERTLRGFSRPMNLKRFDKFKWMTTEEPLWCVAELMCTLPHVDLVTDKQARMFSRLDKRSFAAGLVGRQEH